MIHVACAADAAYVPHAAALTTSLVSSNSSRSVTLHFLHEPGLAAKVLATLKAHVAGLGITFNAHAVSAEHSGDLPRMGRIPALMWLRILLPELLPDVARVLYLDCDTLVMDRLDELWDVDLEGAWLGAVHNVFEPHRRNHPAAQGLEQYFNSGVLLIDLDAWRRERCGQRIQALARNPAAGLYFPDQDALNRVLAGHWKALHPRWNSQNSFFYFRREARALLGTAAAGEAIRRPGILHFEGGALSKPWHYLCKHPYRAEYFRLRARTPWPDVVIEGRGRVNRVLRLLPHPLLIPAFIGVQRLRQVFRAQRDGGVR